MKIRIKGNSVRIRVSKTELEKFGSEGRLEERTEFADSTFVYALQAANETQTLSADMQGNTLTMYMPAAMQQEWVATDVVGYDSNMDTGNGNKLFLLVEKDFKCIDGEVLEDQSDNFENPLAACQ